MTKGGQFLMSLDSHIITDTDSNLLAACVHAAKVRNPDWAAGVIDEARDSSPTLSCLFADGGFAGGRLDVELIRTNRPVIEIIRGKGEAQGFLVIGRRWAVESTLAWIGRCRHLSKDRQTSIASSQAWTLIASIRRLTRRVARQTQQAPES